MRKYKEYECGCVECQKMCKRTPCWPVPEDIEKIMKTKHIKKFRIIMMDNSDYSDNINRTGENVEVLIPMVVPKPDDVDPGYSSRNYVWGYHGKCIFLTKKGLCKLHKGLKPIGGRNAIHKTTHHDIRIPIIKEWNKKNGRIVMKKFKEGDF